MNSGVFSVVRACGLACGVSLAAAASGQVSPDTSSRRGIAMSVGDRLGRTPLHVAALAGEADAVARLLAGGADIHARDALGETPIHAAAKRLRAECVQLLLDAGADPNAITNVGLTPLALGASLGHGDPEQDVMLEKCATLLLIAGADPSVADNRGVTPLGHAKYRGYSRTADLLRGLDAAPGVDRKMLDDIGAFEEAYRTHAQIEQILTDAAANYPALARKVVLGQSVQGRNISALNISRNVGVEENEPELRYISTMHGDEIVGNEMMLYLIDEILTNYGSDAQVTALVDSADLWIVPLMNPDGYVLGQRTNANGYDLNRSFPDPYTSPDNTTAGRQPEVAAIMNWTFDNSFSLSANFHTGALVANYPFDSNPAGSSTFSPSPDENLFVHMSEQYALHNTPMLNSSVFPGGITNGAAWYQIDGGMQDWNYVFMGSNEITVELSDIKGPASSQIPTFWSQNRDSLLAYWETIYTRITGRVTDAGTGAPLAATVTLLGRDHKTYTDPDVGDYHRMVRPGTYRILVEADGYDPVEVTGINVIDGTPTIVDVGMAPGPIVLSPNGGEVIATGAPTTIEWAGAPGVQYQVQQTANYGEQGVTTDGFERTTLGVDYATAGNQPWHTTTSDANAGAYSAQAGDINDRQMSEMSRVIEGPATISFRYRVSSESGFDYFRFLIDDAPVLSRAGLIGWTAFETTVGPGSHTLTWRYDKDFSFSAGLDTAWIDELSIDADVTAWGDVVAQSDPGATTIAWTPTTPTTDARVRVRSILGSGLYGQWDESDASFTIDGDACAPDLTGEGDVNTNDFFMFLSLYQSQDLRADFAADGQINTNDFFAYLAAYQAGC